MKRLYTGLLLVLILGVLVAGCAQQSPTGTSEKPIELKLATFQPPPTFFVKDLYGPWAKEIEERSQGRIKITIWPGGSLGKVEDQYALVLSRQADISVVDLGTIPGVFPLSEAISLPLLFNSTEAANGTWWELTEKYLLDTEFSKVHVLYHSCVAPMQIITSDKQISTLQDFQGVKIGCPTESAVLAFGKLGAVPVYMPITDLYTGIERGLLDGASVPWEAMFAFRFNEITKYRTQADLFTPTISLFMNADTWKSLPPDLQQLFNETGGLQGSIIAGRKFDEVSIKLEEDLRDYDKQKGNPDIYIPPDAERTKWSNAVTPLYEEWITQKESEGLPARSFFNDLKEIAAKYNK